ncbi:hypothetical protein FACS1894152_1650 [Bacilli bacterium]|nr:hypothetical protein FACS1894152_1650 [Bacilli bacterium]
MANLDTYTGNDVVEIDDRLMTDFADGDVAVLTYPNQKIAKISGDNGNVITSPLAGGDQAQMVLRVLINSSDDKYLKLRSSQQDADIRPPV